MEEAETKAKKQKAQKVFLTSLLFLIAVSLVPTLFIPKVKADTYYRTFYCIVADGHLDKDGLNYTTVWESTTSSFVTNTSNTLLFGQYKAGAFYTNYRTPLYFDSSYIPDTSTIDSATLSLYVTYDYSDVDFNLTIQNGQPTYPHLPLQLSDYWKNNYSGDGGSRNTTTISGAGWWNITLNADGRSWINVEGTTKLMMRSSRDINGTETTGNEYIITYAAEQGETYAPKLYVTYDYTPAYQYVLYGAYDEEGNRDGSIDVHFYRPTQETLNFTLDGTNTTDSESAPSIFHFDLGNNYTRVYYVYSAFESIYVFKASEPMNVYYVTLVDYVGITNGYLETIINVNGTDRIVERLSVDVTNVMEFTLSWGHVYKFRVVCDQGSYVLKTHQAGSDTSIILTISSNVFPPDSIHIGDITVSATRTADISIQILYSDAQNLTNWVYIEITEKGETSPVYTTNNTGNTHDITWSSALSWQDYIVYIEANHQEEGTLAWQFSCPALSSYTNPWDLSWLGEWPIDSSQIIGIAIVACVFGAFSQMTAKVGIIATLMVASILVLIGFLNINWGWMATVWCIGILVILSLMKDRRQR